MKYLLIVTVVAGVIVRSKGNVPQHIEYRTISNETVLDVELSSDKISIRDIIDIRDVIHDSTHELVTIAVNRKEKVTNIAFSHVLIPYNSMS